MYNLSNFKRACEIGDVNLIEQIFYLLTREERIETFTETNNLGVKTEIIDLYQKNLSDEESLILFLKTRIDLERFPKLDMELFKYVLDSDIPKIKKYLCNPNVDPGFYNQVIICNAPSIEIGELLTIHPLVDPCCLLNDFCLTPFHEAQTLKFYLIVDELQEIYKVYLKSINADFENKKLYQFIIFEMLTKITAFDSRIISYLKFLKENMTL